MPAVDSYDASLTSIDVRISYYRRVRKDADDAWTCTVCVAERYNSGGTNYAVRAWRLATSTKVPFPLCLSHLHVSNYISSAFFARPISINLVFAQTQPSSLEEALNPSPQSPSVQKRQVNLTCAGRVVCTATSSVVISSPKYAKLFLQDGYAIGQIFRKTGDAPEFELMDVGLVGETDDEKESAQKVMGERKMWRRYTLRVEGFQADIVEVFPDRRMFTRGEAWLDEPQLLTVPNGNSNGHGASPDWTPSLSPTETLVSPDEQWERGFRVPTAVLPPQPAPENTKDTAWLDTTGGLLRFIAVFVAVLLLLNVPRDESDLSGPAGALFSRITRLLDVRQVDS